MKHQHKFARLSDEAIFCACGEIRTAADVACGRQHYPTIYWPAPYTVPYTVPTYPTYPWWGITTGGTTTIGSTYRLDGSEQMTYTLNDGSVA